MATYAIGDVQGCYDELQVLLESLSYDPVNDHLWFVGDLVNRGPKSLETLRFIKSLGDKATVVLGNHDLHCLAVFYGTIEQASGDTLTSLLRAPDCFELMAWLKTHPLFHYDSTLNIAMVHAGLIPAWSITQAIEFSNEVQMVINSDEIKLFLSAMYGDTPHEWHDDLPKWERLRFITNVLTRIRFCSATGELNLAEQGGLDKASSKWQPWFAHQHRQSSSTSVVFGHWARLGGIQGDYNVWGIDTGCVWGNHLTAIELSSIAYKIKD